MDKRRTNFVFFFPDEMRASSVSCYGNERVKMPNYDRMAQEGVRFDNCIIQNPVCTPSRLSLIHIFGRCPVLFVSIEQEEKGDITMGRGFVMSSKDNPRFSIEVKELNWQIGNARILKDIGLQLRCV